MLKDLPADLPANLQVGNNIYIILIIYSPPEENPSEEGRKFFHEINAFLFFLLILLQKDYLSCRCKITNLIGVRLLILSR